MLLHYFDVWSLDVRLQAAPAASNDAAGVVARGDAAGGACFLSMV